MAPWCIYISCFEIAARSGSGRDSVRGSVGAMNPELSRPDGLATVQSDRKQAQSRVCTPGFMHTQCSAHPRYACDNRALRILGKLTTGPWMRLVDVETKLSWV